MAERRGDRRVKWLTLLLVVPCLAVLCVPIYNFDKPRIFGIPFFYAWQIGWIGGGALITWLVYIAVWKDRDV
ncbi:DUF3311 domain-containing protein [Rhizobium sp. XQZ8]|uniref:DUF3311 domain-containing protein n=1 Tax=Rhizobium populisoli TaxID=2859785 RepID=UPI001C663CFF|nr:DUF3311 domain-containing protein [Rhizobium populisoli]